MLAVKLLCSFSFLSAFFDRALGQKVLNLHVNSRIQSRFAVTHVTSEIENAENVSKEVTFQARLPAEAFISNFTMTINGELQVGEVKEKEAARQDFERAKSSGHTAGLVEQRPRETDFFQTSVNVAPGGKVKFNLTYQEVLKRVHGVYKHVINIVAAEEVEDLKVEVVITERGRIRNIHVPTFGAKIGEKTNKELLALPSNPEAEIRNSVADGFATAKIAYRPTTKVGQLAVLYDLERSFNGGEIEVVDGYFVHFFAPQRDSLPVGATNIIFVLDRSGSMDGRKFTQLKDAMKTILTDLKPEDKFSIVWFSTDAEAWNRSLQVANSDNIQAALEFVDQHGATGSTNIHGALIEGLTILQQDKNATGSSAPNMLLFLTDGLATEGEIQGADEIVKAIGTRNRNLKAKIHNLAFGDDADYKMLQQMSSENDGLARKIYEAADAKLQLEGFYSEIANPIFTSLNIEYLDSKVDVSSIVRNRDDETFYEGSEMMTVGKLFDPATTTVRGEVEARGSDGATVAFRCGNECFDCCGGFCPEWCQGWWPCPPVPRPVKTQSSALPASTLRGFVERMWGYMTIKKLLKEAGFEGDTPEGEKKKAEALRLSLHYNFVTELTSLVVVDSEADLDPIKEEEFEEAAFDFLPKRRTSGRQHAFAPGPPGPLAVNGALMGPPAGALMGPPPFAAAEPDPAFDYEAYKDDYDLMPTTEVYATVSETFPTTIHVPTMTPENCSMDLLVILDRRNKANLSHSQVLELFKEMNNVHPEIGANVAISEITDNSIVPMVLQDFSHYRGITSVPTEEPVGAPSFQELLNGLSNGTCSKRVVLVMNPIDPLPDLVLNQIPKLKANGVKVFSYQNSAIVEAFSVTVRDKFSVVSIRGTDHYLIDVSMAELAHALHCS